MADITNIFKATVKTVRTRNKAQGLTSGPDKSILGHSKTPKSEFARQAKVVVGNISKLRDFLLEHRKDYINATSQLGVDASSMTDAERDQIDADAQTFMRACSEAIHVFRSEVKSDEVGAQVKDHRAGVFTLLEIYLKVICKIYSEQKAIRVKRVVDKKRLGRLEPEGKPRTAPTKPKEEATSSDDKTSEKPSTSWQDKASKEKSSKSPPSESGPPIVFDDDEEELSPEEAQMFALENEQMFEEMNSLMNEVKQVEGKVVEIARLQEIFADKVLEQDTDIDRIADTVVGATENIKGANEEIREAMKNNAGLRVWILFFLIVCSFSLLFLDWYND